MTMYTATVSREDDLWVVTVDGLPANIIGAADYDDFATLHADVPALIADLTDAEPGSFGVNYRYIINGEDVTEHITSFLSLNDAARDIESRRNQARKVALEALTRVGLSRRVVANVVDLSHQRVQQLLKAS